MITTPPDHAAAAATTGARGTLTGPAGSGTGSTERTFGRRPSWRSRNCFTPARTEQPAVTDPHGRT
ncbi:hypothetical protein [Nocardia inohanensis]|uniref:hypothetical protein n=1 Tax=Nocardia inohanensis TaxID=209246 RepID=UPI00082F772F|nr:hypothetical protein [Nocardia inohanensis]